MKKKLKSAPEFRDERPINREEIRAKYTTTKNISGRKLNKIKKLTIKEIEVTISDNLLFLDKTNEMIDAINYLLEKQDE